MNNFDEAMNEFEDEITKYGFLADDFHNEVYSAKDIYRSTPTSKAVHYQLYKRGKATQEDLDRAWEIMGDILDKIDKKYDTTSTASMGIHKDGTITVGVDIRDFLVGHTYRECFSSNKTGVLRESVKVLSKSTKKVLKEDEEKQSLDDIAKKMYNFFYEIGVYEDISTDDNSIKINIEFGHPTYDHEYLEDKVRDFFEQEGIKYTISKDITDFGEYDGDNYSAVYTITIPSKKVNESLHPRKRNLKIIKEGGLSRLYSHIKDLNSFAVIGSQDKDTREDRSKELERLVGDLSRKGKVRGFNYIIGKYMYGNNLEDIGIENSLIVYNISRKDALDIGKKLNQETILFKDKDFFGYLNVDDGSVPDWNNEGKGFDGSMTFDPQAIKDVGGSSQLANKGWHLPRNPKSKNAQFVYEGYLVRYDRKNKQVEHYLIDSYNSEEDKVKKDYAKQRRASRKKGQGYFTSYCGNVQAGIDAFNSSTSGEGVGLGEDLEENTYNNVDDLFNSVLGENWRK